jgi:TetR/AcrR family transcriptional repressor of lmrAB and yxaGH operons
MSPSRRSTSPRYGPGVAPPSPRERMVQMAARWLPDRGLAGLNLVELARAVEAPRGSLYHHFPGGRAQLLQETLDLAARSGLRMIRVAAEGANSADDFVAQVMGNGPLWVDAQAFSGGCPIAASLVSAQAEGDALVAQLRQTMADWEAALAAGLQRHGVAAAQAGALAACLLMAFHGAMLYAKGAARPQAFALAARMVQAMLPR